MANELIPNPMATDEVIEILKYMKRDVLSESKEDKALDEAIKALKSQRYQPIILQEHDAEPRRLKAILDTETDEIYICKLTRQGAEILDMTIEEVQNDE